MAYTKRNFSKRREYSKVTADLEPRDAVRPMRDQESPMTSALVGKSLSRLPKSGSSITVKTDPYETVLPGSDPYPILNRTNVKTGGAYKGSQNLDSGLTQQINQSEGSSFLHAFDSLQMRCNFNYRYYPFTSGDASQNRGLGYVRETIRAIDEVISLTKATTFTALAINNYYIKSNLPMPSDKGLEVNTSKYYNCGTPEGLYMLMICYQTYLQSMASIFNYYNKFRANQGLMLKSSWNRNTPRLNQLFSQLNKTAVVNSFASLAFILNGEYFDFEWMRQFNMISSITSRKSNAIMDPILEINGCHEVPAFTLVISAGGSPDDNPAKVVVFDSAEVEAQVFSSSTNTNVQKFDTLTELVDENAYTLSVNNILYWVRNDTEFARVTAGARLNFLMSTVEALSNLASKFKPAMGDLRTMLDVIQRINVNNWTKSVRLEVIKDLDIPVTDNLTVNDIYRNLMSGTTTCLWDDNTSRWTVYTPWDTYLGIPEYDTYNGGSFLTFSAKNLQVPSNSTFGKYAIEYLPKLVSQFLSYNGAKVICLNRLGTRALLDYTSFKLGANRSTARLAPLTGYGDIIEIKAPYSLTTLSSLDESFLMNACLKVFNCYSHDPQVSSTTDLAISQSLLCFIGVEIADLQAEMITYARCNGPFVVNRQANSSIGFVGIM